MKIVGMCQIYNELTTGHLHKMMDHYSNICDELVLLDDASTDGSNKILSQFSENIIFNRYNNWQQGLETKNKNDLLDMALKLDPDWIVSFDCDEMFEQRLDNKQKLETFLNLPQIKDCHAIKFNWVNLWLSERWFRIDGGLGQISPPRIWRNLGQDLMKIEVQDGLHKRLWPLPMDQAIHVNLALLHYSSSSIEKFYNKISTYFQLHPEGNYQKILDPNGIRLCEIDERWFSTPPQYESSPDIVTIHKEIKERLINNGIIGGNID